ncbi:delta-1-pyrroline-5-carboxylate dehydrogenase, mitochondrial [Zeugodacus cucurbitae]|uniref:delta-1-pyrroline-5-carboxylate dehydrogenase, mitochondrial n=1 Tax=Zeugodacus cucurbitae TaxID=28588 RepID=UPI0005969857|nr:delta-1-pyrroline-5-carboxylate dehydrogenase, mitochondrial [Zeugodacus cucurbitae]
MSHILSIHSNSGSFMCNRAMVNLAGKRFFKNMMDYKANSMDSKALFEALDTVQKTAFRVPINIGENTLVGSDEQRQVHPHNHRRTLVKFYYANTQQIKLGIETALCSKKHWQNTNLSERAEIWRKCADIIAEEDHHMLNAAIILGQAKTPEEAEKDTFQLINLLRKSADYILRLSQINLSNSNPERIKTTYFQRPLNGFVSAISPFNHNNFSAHLALSPALMGNCVLWKPSSNSIYSDYLIWKAAKKAGMPPGVLNFIPCNGNLFVDVITKSPYFGGLNFAGRTSNFHNIFNVAYLRLKHFKSLPRMVAECSTKNFHFVHESADVHVVAEATIQAAFEYSGQKCSACSCIYVPETLWVQLKPLLLDHISRVKVGDPCDFTSATSAVISEIAYERIIKYIRKASDNSKSKIIYGGNYCKSHGYFIEPTVVVCNDPLDPLMTQDICGPVLSVYLYKNNDLDKIVSLLIKESTYAYTASVFADLKNAHELIERLSSVSNNFYINGSCSGNIMGHPRFSGTRLSGTNDHKSSKFYFMRWTCQQLIEESIDTKSKTDKKPL